MKWRFFAWERISRNGNDEYLYRLKIFQCPLFGIFLHWFIGSDDECKHDHPWSFVSIILYGGYWEEAPNGKLTWYPAGSILRRMNPARCHRVVIDKPAMSLVIIGPKKRSWGFHTPLGWIHWLDYRYSEHCAGG